MPSRLSRLPPGRHGLPREFVDRNQRDRISAGIIAAVADLGYHEATITAITDRAGVSRRTFYHYFSSKQECFLATFDLIASYLQEAMAEAAADAPDWPAAVRAKLATLLATFAANPDLARFVLIAPSRAGEEIAARYRLAIDRGLEIFSEGLDSAATRTVTLAAREATMGGVAALIVSQVEAGNGEHLPELMPDLLELMLAPYLGRAKAASIARSIF